MEAAKKVLWCSLITPPSTLGAAPRMGDVTAGSP